MASLGGASQEPDIFEIGNVIDDQYVISARLGKGGYGEIYRATSIKDGTIVAVKVERASKSGNLHDELSILNTLTRTSFLSFPTLFLPNTLVSRSEFTFFAVAPFTSAFGLPFLLLIVYTASKHHPRDRLLRIFFTDTIACYPLYTNEDPCGSSSVDALHEPHTRNLATHPDLGSFCKKITPNPPHSNCLFLPPATSLLPI